MQRQGGCSKFLIITPHSSSQVTWHTAPGTVVPCSAATAICQASPECEIALHYFNTNCKELFKGGECTEACRNSARILARQRAAAKLATCTCADLRSNCASIRENTNSLCFDKDNTVSVIKKKKQSGEKDRQTQGLLNIENDFCLKILLFRSSSANSVRPDNFVDLLWRQHERSL